MNGPRNSNREISFEQGPIRPPSEATSLLVRVTRNCPWNRCTFCPVYKGKRFSRRSVGEVLADIEAMRKGLEEIRRESWKTGHGGELSPQFLSEMYQDPSTSPFLRSLLVWLSGGGKSAFLQDADSLVVKPEELATVLRTLRKVFPFLERVTCYARSQTLSRRSLEDLRMLKEAGLDRVHVGLESGSDAVLNSVRKGCTAEKQIRGGRAVVGAGLELSEYVMPGLGGRSLSREHALGTARVLNAIHPHFIRLRSLAVPEGSPLAEEMKAGRFEWPTDVEIVEEIRLFIEHLDGIHSTVTSDHILNLLMEVEGKLPGDKDTMLSYLDRFLSLSSDDQETFIIGRRSGLFRCLDDMAADPQRRRWAEERRDLLREREGVDAAVRNLVRRFI